MNERFLRSELIFGKDGLEKLRTSRVAVFGAGGVGGYVIEALARSGVGQIDIIDSDTVAESNINRQIIALDSTVGKYKTELFRERIHEINPDCKIRTYPVFFTHENSSEFDFSAYTYAADAIDTVSGKTEIIIKSYEADIPVISSMGTGNKINPAMLEISDIYKTSVCPLARVMRHELRKRNIPHLKVVYSREDPILPKCGDREKRIPGSAAFVPPAAGMLIASEIVKDIVYRSEKLTFRNTFKL